MKSTINIASSSKDRLSAWRQVLCEFVCPTLIHESLVLENLEILRESVIRVQPDILVLDIELLDINGAHDIKSLRSICAETKTIISSGEISADLEWELLKAGIRGCCRSGSDAQLMKQVVEAIERGELWVRRSLISRLVDELSQTTAKNKAYRATHGLLHQLTQRELDIAMRVGKGESNKLIAQQCGITERTVKAHLTEIFQKMGVTDRLNLALILVADSRAVAENTNSHLSAQTGSEKSSTIKEYLHIPTH